MAAADASAIYWLPWLRCYQSLQAANSVRLAELEGDLKLLAGWLLEGGARFKPPSAASAAALSKGGPMKAAAFGPGKGFAVDKQLVQATLELSQLLGLDELQCHLLLKRLLKEQDIKLAPPTTATAASTGSDPAAAAAPSSPSPLQVVLPAEVVQAAADYYGQERVYLAKCQQHIIMTAMDLTADASQVCRGVLRTLLEQDLGGKVFANLEALLSPKAGGAPAATAATPPGAAAGGAAGSIVPAAAAAGEADGGTHLVKPPSLEQHLYLHLLNERCEVVCLLTQLYSGASPFTCPAVHDLEARQRQPQDGDVDMQDEEGAAAAAAVAGFLSELQDGLRWPSCSEERFIRLVQLLGGSVFSPAAGFAAAAAAPASLLHGAWPGAASRAWLQEGGPGDSGSGGGSQAAVLQQLSEALASSLILAALRPAQMLQDLAAAASRGTHSTPNLTATITQWRTIEPDLAQWRPVAGNVVAMLAIYATNRLAVTFNRAGGVDAMQESCQERAMRAGGFAACGAALSLEELAGSTLAGCLHRGLLLQGMSLVAAAFTLNPWELPAAMLSPLVDLIGDVVQGCPHLAEQVWDASAAAMLPLRRFLEDCAQLFPAFLDPFLRLATGLTQGPAAAQACYQFISHEVAGMAMELGGPDVPGVQVLPNGQQVVVVDDLPWPKAPEVNGTDIPSGIYGHLHRLPAFARPPAPADSSDMDDGGAGAGQGDPTTAALGPWPLLAVWEVQADQGTGPVLLLARAAHCLQRLHVLEAARQPVAGSTEWQDLRLILQLLAALLRHEPMLASRLLAVLIVYNNNQTLDWVDVIIAALNVLPGLALATAASLPTGARQAAAAQHTSGSGDASDPAAFCWSLLHSMADCLAAAGVAAGSQPSRVLGALCGCALLEGVAEAVEPLEAVPLEGLASWVQQQQSASRAGGAAADGGVNDWSQLTKLQALQELLEVPAGSYPLTVGVVNLTASLLAMQANWGPVPSLVGFALHRVLGAMPWLPFTDAAARWRLAACALEAVRLALLSGAQGVRGGAGPKALGAPSGVAVSALAAKMIHHLATAGHGYLSAVLPPPAHILRDMADQVTGSSQLLAAGRDLAQQLLLLVPLLLGACAHLSPEMPLQQYWAAEPPGGGLRPAAVIASFVTYAYSAQLQMQAWDALNAFALLQAPAFLSSGRSGLGAGGGGAPTPSGGGPPVPLGAPGIAGLGALQGLVQPGLSPSHALGLSHQHGMAAAGTGVGGRGGAGGWWRPSGLFAALLAALPGLRGALLSPLQPAEAAAYPGMAVKALELLEAGIRFFPEILDALCFPTSLAPEQQQQQRPDRQSKAAAKPFSALDGLLQLLKTAPQLLKAQPRLLAAVLRVLRVLWECRSSAHGAVELLRAQPAFWEGLKACLPVPSRLPAFSADADLADGAAAAWQLQVHACSLQIVLLEILAGPPDSSSPGASAATAAPAAGGKRGATSDGGSVDAGVTEAAAAEAGREALLRALSPADLMALLLAVADVGQQPQLLAQLSALLQITYLQVGATAVRGAWGPPGLKSDALRAAAGFRREVQPLTDALAAGQFSQEDLRHAAALLAARYAPDADADAGTLLAGGKGGDADGELLDDCAGDSPGGRGSTSGSPAVFRGAAGGSRGRELMGRLLRAPFGEVLLSRAAAGLLAWAAPETEYGSAYLYDPLLLEASLGPEVMRDSDAAVALLATLMEVNTAASVGHARLVLLQAGTSLLHSLARLGWARSQLMQPAVSQALVQTSVQAVSRSLAAAVALGSTEAAPLVLCPWGLNFAAYTSSAGLLLSCRVLMLSVCTWKAAAAKAELATVSSSGNGGSKRSAGRPVLMARNLNSHHAAGAAGSKQQQQQQLSAKGLSTVVEEADGALADAGTAMALSAQCAALLSQWLRGTGGDSLRQASKLMLAGGGGAAAYAAAGGAAAATFEQYIEVVECLSTVLLMLLQALPAQQARAAAASSAAVAAAAAAGGSGGDRSPIARAGSSTVSRAAAVAAAASAAANGSAAAVVAAATPGELSQLETALLDVLPALADASAIAISQEGGSGAAAGGSSTTAVEAREAYAAPMLQLLIEILQHQLPHELWLGTVSQHLALVPMLGVVAGRAGSSTDGSDDSAAAAAAAAVAVTDVSVLELVRAVAAAPDGAMQLWQQGVLPVLVGFCRQLLHARDRHSGLLDAAALGMVGPNADAAGLSGELSAAAAASLATLGAYTTAGSSSGSQQQQSAGDGGIVWAPRHQQWCLLLELWGVLLQQLSRNVDVTATAVELLVAAEPRLLLAVQLQGSNDGVRDSSGGGGAPGRGSQQHDGRGGASSSGPGALDFLSAFGANGASAAAAAAQAAAAARLTLGNLLEAERSLRLLRFMVGHLGEWQLQRPGSLAAFRAAAASLVEFCARPSTDRAFRVSCAPLSPFERKLSRLPSGLEAGEGWFKLCAAGGANSHRLAAAVAAAAGGGSKALVPAGSSGAGGSDAAAAGGGSSCSEYCARLGEAVCSACEAALEFLAATAPAVDPAEVAGAAAAGALGPMWPSVRALTALQDQALAVGECMTRDQPGLSARRSRIALCCCRIMAAAGQLLEALSPGGVRSAGARTDAAGADAAARKLERMSTIQRAASLSYTA